MNEQEKQVPVTHDDIREIKRDMNGLSAKVSEVHAALIGSPLVRDGGLVKRLQECEDGLDKLQERVMQSETAAKQREFYIRWIWGLVAFVVGTVFVEFIRYFFHDKK